MAMTQRALRALKKSIRKWKDIVDHKGGDKGTQNCALCHYFMGRAAEKSSEEDVGECEGCPVSGKTGFDLCSGSPYQIWNDHQHRDHEDLDDPKERLSLRIECEECHLLAQEEWEFLKSLLPKEKEDQ